MAAPSLDSDHPGLKVLAEVAEVLAVGFPSDEALSSVVGVLRRGLGLRRCRLWVRSADGPRYAPITTPGDEAELPGYVSPTAPWLRGGPHREPSPGGSILYLPLSHEEETLGALEVIIPQGRYEHMAHDVIVVAAKILAPMIAGMELSQDLASEVALRTREVEAQRSFAARIIDSLPVGLYVIDRSYHIRAWNRKRETGTEGVAREDAVGREVFEVLDRQPRELLKREFDRVFDTGEIQEVEVETQTPGGPRHYRITKVPMREDADDISHVITIGDVLADGDDVGDVVGILPHRNLGDAIVARPPGRLGLDFDLLDLARVEHPVELAFQQLARLAVQHLEHFAPHRVLARHALRARLPLAVPGADVVGAVDHVQPDGQGVDDAGREAALRLDLAGAQRHLRGQVLRQLHARDHGGEDLRRDDDDVVRHLLVTPLGDDHFQGTERFFFVTERQVEDRSARRRLTMRSAPQPRGRRRSVARPLGLVARCGDGGVAAAVGAAHPQAAAAQAQPPSQHAHHRAEGLVGGKADRQHLGHLGEDLEARMIEIGRA